MVIPLSVLASWRGDVAAYCSDTIKCYAHFGSRDEREENFDIWASQVKHSLADTSSSSGAIHVCLASYDIVLRDSEMFLSSMKRRSLQWSYIVVGTYIY